MRTVGLRLSLIVGALFSGSAAAGTITATDLYEAMEMDSADVTASSITATLGSYDTLTDLGVFLPQKGSDMSILHTGLVGDSPEPGVDLGPMGAAGDRATLELQLTVPSYANSFALSFAFFSAEFPEWVGSPYNDAFELYVSGTAYSGNAAVDSAGNVISINSALFTVVHPSDLTGTTFDGGLGGGTGWLMVVVPVDPGDTIDLEMTIYDRSDGSYDSAVLIDDFEWSEADIDTPTIVEPIDLFYLSPKRGSTEGGDTTSLYGDGFSSACVAEFDGVEVDTVFVDESELMATTEPHDVGLVDVTVTCPGTDTTLIGGYSFYSEESSSGVPEVTSIDPYELSTWGGETVTLSGTDLDLVTSVWIDEEEIISFTTVSDTQITFVSPAHDEGWADLTYVDASGWSEQWLGGLLYIAESVDTGGFDSGLEDPDTGDLDGEDADEVPSGTAGGCSCASSPAGAAGWWVLGVVGLLWSRRRTGRAVVTAALLGGCSEYELTDNTERPEGGEDTAMDAPPVAELEPPVAVAAVGTRVKRLEPTVLDGTGSYDPDGWAGDPLSYQWTLTDYPEGATGTLENASTATPEFSADLLGAYTLTLTVTDADGLVSENLSGTVIEVVPWENLVVVLDWDTEELDVDLHMLSPDGLYYDEGDCYFGNPTPDWGQEGVTIDDPLLDGDQESGGEPETIYLWQPEEGVYSFYVHYFNRRGAETEWTWPTLDIYVEGELYTTIEGPRLTSEGKVWIAGSLDWTTLEYTESSELTTHEELGGPAVNEKD
jgi:MYXO-CTERM domain-containing protein